MKPEILYHASPTYKEVLEPKEETKSEETEGPKVFATPSRAFASIFLIPWDDSWVRAGAQDGAPYIVVRDKHRFLSTDTGGFVYTLSINGFEPAPNKSELEWASSVPVTPLGIDSISSGMDDMLRHDVRIYFVDEQTFQAFTKAHDHSAFLESLEVYQ